MTKRMGFSPQRLGDQAMELLNRIALHQFRIFFESNVNPLSNHGMMICECVENDFADFLLSSSLEKKKLAPRVPSFAARSATVFATVDLPIPATP